MIVTLILSVLVVALGVDRILLTNSFKDFKESANGRIKNLELSVDTTLTSLRQAVGPKLRELHDRVETLESNRTAGDEPEKSKDTAPDTVTGQSASSHT